MITLNLSELNKIKEICELVGVERFTLEQQGESGIGNILTMSYESKIADYTAKVSIEVSGVESW